jgi:hypothetical protein
MFYAVRKTDKGRFRVCKKTEEVSRPARSRNRTVKCGEELEAWAERRRLQLLAPEGLNGVLGSRGKPIN